MRPHGVGEGVDALRPDISAVLVEYFGRSTGIQL